jgi:hypothetical protein
MNEAIPSGVLSEYTFTDVGEDFAALRTLPGLRGIDNWTIDADEGVCSFSKKHF